MNRTRTLLVPSILTCALLAVLVLATTASAEIRVGEATALPTPSVPPEADVIAAMAEYDSATGAVAFKVTTAGVPWPGTEGEPSETEMEVGLASPSSCSAAMIGTTPFPVPIFVFQYKYVEPGRALWTLLESATSTPERPETIGDATVSTSGTTTNFVATVPRATNLAFSCAVVGVRTKSGSGPQPQPLIFPIAVPPPPPPPTPTTPAPTQAQAKASTPLQAVPAALSIARSKALRLKAGKWKRVRVKVTNTGGSATAPGSLRLKAPRGVLVKPEKQRLPVLSAGGSWTVSAKVKLTAKAKKKSTVALTAAAGGLTAKGSLVLKH